MRTLKTLMLSLLMISTPVFAMQLCPASLTVSKGTPATPTGWTVSKNEMNPIAKLLTVNLEFGISGYNTNPEGGKDNRISCYYFGNERGKVSMVVITTDQTGYAKPSTAGTKWKFDDTNTFAFCGMGDDNVKPVDCPWG